MVTALQALVITAALSICGNRAWFAGDFTLASAAPLHAMLQEGIVDKNIKFTPVLDNLRMPDYIDWELRPFTNHTVCHQAEYGQHMQNSSLACMVCGSACLKQSSEKGLQYEFTASQQRAVCPLQLSFPSGICIVPFLSSGVP